MIDLPHALVDTAFGIATLDLEEDELVALEPGGPLAQPAVEGLALPRLVAADAYGSRIVAVVDRKPPLVVSDDAGATWHETGGGLPPGRAVAISGDHPDLVLYASETRVYVSRDGGRFWRALQPELVGITAVAWED
jgi:photosystem II stability/assembly factor-like uncharacterized protein